ncbi:22672_t:CDS:2, partial [Racocetra persica]
DMGKAFFSESYGILLNCHENFYEFKKVFDYCERYQDQSLPLGERLLAYAFIECIGNNWVRVEEGMHVSGHFYVYKIIGGVSKPRAKEIYSKLVDCVKNMWETRILSNGKNEVNGFTLKQKTHSRTWSISTYTSVNFFESRITEYSTIHEIEYNDRVFDN